MLQVIAHVPQLGDQAFDLVDRRAGNALDEGIEIARLAAALGHRPMQGSYISADEIPEFTFEFRIRLAAS
jgi:hypothetical protein